ncbi:MAG: alanine--tRNA ligase [Clostridia bacterium]|nr:alanine--tRNA ligase [Clostridia bacterium]
MKQITSAQLREMFQSFMESKGHHRIQSASVIPENDPTVLFTTAGMHPLVPYLMGTPHPAGTRLTDVQKCIRTGDIDDVGDPSHLTFFEMLGNWSLGDYFKEQAISQSWEFLTSPEYLGLEKDRLAFSVFAGDDDCPRDVESHDLWRSMGVAEDHIFYLPKENNWWGPAGLTGPCGPDTEMFIITDKEPCGPDCSPACSCGRYLEIWNDVFMQYNKQADGTFVPLAKKNVDTGMGLERTIGVLTGKKTVYETDAFTGIINRIAELSGKEYGSDEETTKAFRIIADHMRTSTFILGDERGIGPSNTDQGYILRRLIRRAVRYGMQLGMTEGFTAEIAKVIIDQYKAAYPELGMNSAFVIEQLTQEESRFAKTLKTGEKEFEKLWNNLQNTKAVLESILTAEDSAAKANELAATKKLRPSPDMLPIIEAGKSGDSAAVKAAVEARMAGLNVLDGRSAFKLYDTYGFPIEMTMELAAEKGLTVDREDFDKRFNEHQEKSRNLSAGAFKGGLQDHSEETTKLHTATHLLQAALRKVLGDEVYQKGSNITAERLRFDFAFNRKVTPDELAEVEKLVNEAIAADLPVVMEEMTVPEAIEKGAMHVFESKYGEKVRTYKMGDFSFEICGGPHVEHTGELGSFKIKKEEASSAGVRRIKAVVMPKA